MSKISKELRSCAIQLVNVSSNLSLLIHDNDYLTTEVIMAVFKNAVSVSKKAQGLIPVDMIQVERSVRNEVCDRDEIVTGLIARASKVYKCLIKGDSATKQLEKLLTLLQEGFIILNMGLDEKELVDEIPEGTTVLNLDIDFSKAGKYKKLRVPGIKVKMSGNVVVDYYNIAQEVAKTEGDVKLVHSQELKDYTSDIHLGLYFIVGEALVPQSAIDEVKNKEDIGICVLAPKGIDRDIDTFLDLINNIRNER